MYAFSSVFSLSPNSNREDMRESEAESSMNVNLVNEGDDPPLENHMTWSTRALATITLNKR